MARNNNVSSYIRVRDSRFESSCLKSVWEFAVKTFNHAVKDTPFDTWKAFPHFKQMEAEMA